MSSKNNIVLDKSYQLALDVIELSKRVSNQEVEHIIIKQLIRSGTSVGANLQESVGGRSKKDFLNKLYIAYKEARESLYWMNLLKDSHYISIEEYSKIGKQLDEIIRILGASIRTTRADVD